MLQALSQAEMPRYRSLEPMKKDTALVALKLTLLLEALQKDSDSAATPLPLPPAWRDPPATPAALVAWCNPFSKAV